MGKLFLSHQIQKKGLRWYEVAGMSYLTLFSISFGVAHFIWVIVFVAFLGLLTVCLLLCSLWWWLRSWRLRYTKDIVLLVWGVVNVGLFFVLDYLHPTEAHKMEAFYEAHRNELNELCRYARTSVPPSTYFHLEFDAERLKIFHIKAPSDSVVSHHWDDAEAKKDSLMHVIGLTPQRLNNIKRRLERLGCIGVTIGEEPHTTVIDYKRGFLGMYSFRLFDRPMTDKDYQRYLNNVSTIPYSRMVVFEYGGGAINPDDFPGKEKYLKERNRHQTVHAK